MKKISSLFTYPYPTDPSNWNEEEKRFSKGIRDLFDILFARKTSHAFLSENSVGSSNLMTGSVTSEKLDADVGTLLDISENQTIIDMTEQMTEDRSTAQEGISAAQESAGSAVNTANSAQNTAAQALGAAQAVGQQLDTLGTQISQTFPLTTLIISTVQPSGMGTWNRWGTVQVTSDHSDIGTISVPLWHRDA